jgi:hypothetical protein
MRIPAHGPQAADKVAADKVVAAGGGDKKLTAEKRLAEELKKGK